jgi:formate hydrogenlyase subunit 4
MNASQLYALAVPLVLAPLLPGVINRVKARFAGRRGKPLAQTYLDLAKLGRKGVVYSRTTTWVFKAGPVVNLACTILALGLLPLGPIPAVAAFPGDFLLFSYLLALGRFATIAAALDTGSSFEGMGASREAIFSCLAEPVLFLGLLALARHADSLSLSVMLQKASQGSWFTHMPVLGLVGACLGLITLSECSRIPFDDPNTHLELTMIHEVMVLDHGGPDLAFITYAAALKLWLLGSLAMAVLLPAAGFGPLEGALLAVAGLLLFAVAVGVVESMMARLRLSRIPSLLATAAACCALALALAKAQG